MIKLATRMNTEWCIMPTNQPQSGLPDMRCPTVDNWSSQRTAPLRGVETSNLWAFLSFKLLVPRGRLPFDESVSNNAGMGATSRVVRQNAPTQPGLTQSAVAPWTAFRTFFPCEGLQTLKNLAFGTTAYRCHPAPAAPQQNPPPKNAPFLLYRLSSVARPTLRRGRAEITTSFSPDAPDSAV